MAGPTNGQLEEQIADVAEAAKVASEAAKIAAATGRAALTTARAVQKDVAEIKEWLAPLRNGTGSKVSKISVLVDLAEEGQQARHRRETLADASDILFGWIPFGFRKVGAVLAIVFAFFGGVSGIGWAFLSMHAIWQLIHP